MICYQKVILSMNYSGYCDFPMLLNQTNYTLDLVNNKINKWVSNSSLIIIDNTPFPINGANGIADILIASSYLISIAPSNTYHNWTEICKHILIKLLQDDFFNIFYFKWLLLWEYHFSSFLY